MLVLEVRIKKFLTVDLQEIDFLSIVGTGLISRA